MRIACICSVQRQKKCGNCNCKYCLSYFQAQRNYLIKELITWKDYEIQIAAYNNMGIGVFSDGVKIKTREGGMWPGLKNIFAAFCVKRRGFRWVVKGGGQAVFSTRNLILRSPVITLFTAMFRINNKNSIFCPHSAFMCFVWILRKWGGVVGTGWSWLRIGAGGGRL